MNQNFKDLLSAAVTASNLAWEAVEAASCNAPDEDFQDALRELSRQQDNLTSHLEDMNSAIADVPNGPNDDELERIALGDYEVHDGLSTGEREDIERQLTAKENHHEEFAWPSISASQNSSPK